jgi:hypothetical protein
LYAKYENIEVSDGNVYVDGISINTLVAEHILDFLSKGLDCTPIFKFVIKLQNNPSKRAVDEAYTWLANRSFGITDTGNVLGYKAVRSNYLDIYSGTFDNNIGQVHSMPRNKVDDDKTNGCSYGFHVGTQEYATDFCHKDGHIMAVEFDPADIVSVPSDCNFQKLRVCRYMVVDEVEGIMEEIYQSKLASDNDSLFDSWDDEDNEDDDEYPTCSDCGEESCGNCEECDCCEGCCNCSDYDGYDEPEGGCMGDPDEPQEIQLELNLDNKMQVHWSNENINFKRLLNYLYSSRRIHVAQALRRDINDYDNETNVTWSTLQNYISEDDTKSIYDYLKS